MKALNAAHALGNVVVDELIRCGLTHACLSPGSRSTPLALALAQRFEISLKVVIDERSAAFMALGIAKRSSKPVAMLTTSGTAVANVFPAVVEAHQSNIPLMLLTADRPPELRDTGAGQTIDQLKIFGDFVRWFAEVGVPEAKPHSVAYWRSLSCRGFFASTGARPGPVHLNFGFREPLTQRADDAGFDFSLDGRDGAEPWAPVSRAKQEPTPDEVERLAAKTSTTERGLIVVGPSTAHGGEIASLSERSGWPVLAEVTSNARTGPHAISTYEALLRDQSFAKEHRPDFVLRIGAIGLSSALSAFLDPKVRQVSIDPFGQWFDPARSASQFIQADPGLVCRTLTDALPARGETAWQESWVGAEGRARQALDDYLDGLDEVSEPAVARDLAKALPDGWNLVAASSMPVRDLDWFMQPRGNLRVLSNRGANGIDGFVSTAIGVALASGGRTAALCGDLSLLHDQNGLLPSAGEQPDVIFVVINNDGGGIFSFLPQAEDDAYFEKLFGTPHGLDLAKLASTYGAGYARLAAPSDISPALKAAQSAGGLQIIEARTYRARNVQVHRDAWAAVTRAVS